MSWVNSAKVLEKAGVAVDPSVQLAAHLENGKRLRKSATSGMVVPGFTHCVKHELASKLIYPWNVTSGQEKQIRVEHRTLVHTGRNNGWASVLPSSS